MLRMNLAKALEPYRHDAVFTQSPQFKDTPWKADRADTSSALLHRETADTAFQYPFALNCDDCLYDYPTEKGKRAEAGDGKPRRHPEGATWARALLKAIGELSNTSGNHARSLFFMAPASIVIRLTEQLCPGYEQYHFSVRRDPATNRHIYESSVVNRLLADNPVLPRNEFYIGGEVVEKLTAKEREKLETKNEKGQVTGVTLDPDPRRLLMTVADRAFGSEPKGEKP